MLSLRRIELGRVMLASAVFRLTLRFGVIFFGCLMVLGIVSGLATRWYVQRDARSVVEERLAEARDAFDRGGLNAMAAFIRDVAQDADQGGLAVGHHTAEGELLLGTLAVPAPTIDWITFAPQGIDDDEALWVKSARLTDGTWLSVGASSEFYHDVSEFMLAGAAWTVAVGLPLALLSGALLSRAVLRRLAPIAATADGVREGELSRRAPVTGSGDEFDSLASNINAMLEQIESLTRNLRNVSVGIAHELRSPLARLRNRLVELKDPGLTRGCIASAVDGGLAEIESALATFDALLKIGQIEADARRQDFKSLKLSELVTELAEIYAPVAAESGKRLDAVVGTEVELVGNRALLAQMISNLLENAIEHTPEGTRITLALNAEGDHRELVVADDGPGIPEAESNQVFERFYRLERSRGAPGNGLGLSLVKSICSLHGFAIRLVGANPGARFEITV